MRRGYNVDSTKEHTDEQQILSICYGYGGLERGVSSVVPIRPVAYVEIEAFQNFNLVAAMESGMVDPAPIWTDLKTFDAKPFRNKLHGIIGGYPCQGESLAGKRELWNDDRFLWPYIENIMRTARPLWGFFENVAGHLSGSFPYVLDSLRAMGYKVEAGLYSAEEAGAPHQRKRMFILAVENSYHSRSRASRSDLQRKRKEINEGREKQPFDGISGSSKTELGNTQMPERKSSSGTRSGRSGFTDTGSKELANADGIRSRQSLQRTEPRKLNKNGIKWPAPRGHKQYEWEEPRTVKPGLGCTVNGYNFRTELLRQYGNGVVSQTASIAFKDLIEKI
tara:strand:- start:21954 stop:22961 length:1008 start_codon:yes stop_codon:yes gene_type:complete